MSDARPGSKERPLRVGIVGSGPSAFYAAEALFKVEGLHVAIDMLERLPTPYGLVRGGVAPDHQKIKNVIRVYEKVAAQPGFRFFGHVALGRDLEIEDLEACCDQIVFAVGNESDRRMGIPGEELEGVHSATEFVGWYNGHPDFQGRSFDLGNARRVAVVGNGNVAMDVTRILMKRPQELAATDIADPALQMLGRSKVSEVVLLGRRGPAQAAFSPKEIAELADLDGCDLVVEPEQMALDEVSRAWLEAKAPRAAKRNVAFLTEQAAKGEGQGPRRVRCRFLVSPVAFLGEGRVCGVRLEHAELRLDASGTPRPHGLGRYSEEPVELVFKAVGYRGVPVVGVPFDERRGVIPNQDGRVTPCDSEEPIPGQYVVGWAKRGPTGLIGTNSPDSKATVEAMVLDLGKLAAGERRDLSELLTERGVESVSFADWQRLDRLERERGEARGKVREKLLTIEEMMAVIRDTRS